MFANLTKIIICVQIVKSQFHFFLIFSNVLHKCTEVQLSMHVNINRFFNYPSVRKLLQMDSGKVNNKLTVFNHLYIYIT